MECREMQEAKMGPARDEGLSLAIEAAGSINKLARALGMSQQALSEWRSVPAGRIVQVEAITGVPREKLRPDLYRKPSRSKK
jgi:DNA-binding transcriptional regulator YdaS (Cro superfamily)